MDHQRGDDGKTKHAEDVPDLTKLNDITLPTVLDCLIDRFHHGKYSTFAGTVLVALNPCSSKRSRRHSPLKSYENQDVRRFVELTHCSSEPDVKNLEPHVLSIGVKSLYNIDKVGNNQVIVVSGDSGAGKTTCTQDLIKFFTYSDTEPNNDMWTLEKKIYEATLILEALGNASTTANPNSSRFGRLVRLQYSQESKIIGAEIKTYMLEKHRVAKGNLNERNFHIFHYLFHAVEHGYIEGRNKSVYNNSFWSGNVQDGDLQQFANLSTRLTMLDSLDHFIQVFELLFAIMHLLAVEFKVDSVAEEDKENFTAHRPKHFKVSSKTQDHLDSASAILGISTTELHNSLVYNTFSAGNRTSVSLSPCASKEDCESRLHSFISTLYERLFHHVVTHINALLNQHSSKSSVLDYSTPVTSTNNEPNSCTTTVSILDLYGFENLDFNHFEQLCINYANERIQQVQISVLKGYFEEDRRVSNFNLTDEPVELNRVENETNLRLEELHQRVFCILDEACLLKRPTPDKEIFQQLAIKSAKDQFIKTGQPHDDKCPFIIQHYASDVNYSMAGMIMKNKDFIPDEFISILSRSSKSFICDLFPHKSLEPEVAVNTPRRGKPEGRKTILMRFKFSVNELVGELLEKENRDVHFIKCIRPNVDLLTDLVQPELVRKQLFACGIVDIIRIAGNGYPIRISTDKLEKDFQFLFRKLLYKNYPCSKPLGWQDRLVQIFSSKSSPLKFGKSYAFMTESILSRMRKFDSLIKWKSAKQIQSTWRTFISELKKRRAQLEVAATRIQRCWRAYCLELKIKQNELDKTPVPTSSSSCNSSLYFTPMTSSISSTFYSVGTHNTLSHPNQSNLYFSIGSDMSISTSTSEDLCQQPDSSWLNCSTDMNITNDTEGTITPCETRFDNAIMMETSGSTLLCMESEKEISNDITPNPTLLDATHELTFWKGEPRGQQVDVFVGDGVISRSAVHTLPIKIYTKKTALGYIKPPKRLTSNGIEDAFEDYKIVIKKSLFPPPRQSTFLGENSDLSENQLYHVI